MSVQEQYTKSELIEILDGVRMTTEERKAYVSRIEQYPQDPVPSKNLPELGLEGIGHGVPMMVADPNLTRVDKIFGLQEAGIDVWMIISGAVFVIGGFYVSDVALQIVMALFGIGGIFIAITRLGDLWGYLQKFKSQDHQ